MGSKIACSNMNHGKLNPLVLYCPNCGEKFKVGFNTKCSDPVHDYRRKTGCTFCYDCGKSLKAG